MLIGGCGASLEKRRQRHDGALRVCPTEWALAPWIVTKPAPGERSAALREEGRSPPAVRLCLGDSAVRLQAVLHFALSEDCHLRFFEEADGTEFHRLIEANRDHLTPWMPWAAEATPETTQSFIRLTRRQVADNDGFQTAIVYDGSIAGVVGFHRVDWLHRSTSIGYWLDAGHQGRGIMTGAVRALVDHAVHQWGLNRVEISAAPDNRRSRAIPERLGFRQEGVLREAERVGDRYLDSVVYAVLASEWSGNRTISE
jgi:ribosomal-protein-serine acetyltransferase